MGSKQENQNYVSDCGLWECTTMRVTSDRAQRLRLSGSSRVPSLTFHHKYLAKHRRSNNAVINLNATDAIVRHLCLSLQSFSQSLWESQSSTWIVPRKFCLFCLRFPREAASHSHKLPIAAAFRLHSSNDSNGILNKSPSLRQWLLSRTDNNVIQFACKTPNYPQPTTQWRNFDVLSCLAEIAQFALSSFAIRYDNT
jgi:hypothetical protein